MATENENTLDLGVLSRNQQLYLQTLSKLVETAARVERALKV